MLELFIKEANLTQIEEQVIRTRVRGWTRTQQARELHISLATLDRIIKRLKVKYDAAQKHHPDIMPERRESAEELYMDTH